MSKKQVWFLLIVLAILAISSFLYWLKESDFISDKIRLAAKEGLEPILDQPVEIEEADLTLLPPSIALINISSSGKTGVSVKDIQVYFSLWTFLTQSFLIRDIVVQSPVLSLGEDSKFKFKEKESKPSVVPRRIQIEGGTLSFKTKDKEIRLSPLEIRISPNSAMDRFDIVFSGKGGHVALEKQKKKVNRFEGAVVVHPDGIDIKGVSATLDKTDMATEGVIKLSKESFKSSGLNLKMRATFPMEEYLPLLPIASKSVLVGDLMLQGQAQGTLSNPILTGKIALPRLSLGGNGPDVNDIGSLLSDFSFQSKKFSMDNISAKLFSGEVTGSAEGTLAGGSAPGRVAPLLEKNAVPQQTEYRLSLKYDRLDIEKAAMIFMERGGEKGFKGLSLNGRLLISGRGKDILGEGETEVYRNTNAVSIKPAAFPPKQEEGNKISGLISLLEEGRLIWKWAEGVLSLPEGRITFPYGNADFEGRFHPKEGFSLNVRIGSDKIEEVATVMNLPVAGRLQLVGTVSGPPRQPFIKGRLQLSDWSFKQQPLGSLQTELFYLDKTILLQKGSMQGLPFVITQSPQGRLPSQELAVQSPPLGLYQFGGIVRFAEELAYHFTTDVASVNPQEIMRLFNASIPLSTTATGNLLIEGSGKRVVVTGPLALGEGVLYGESFRKGKLSLMVTDEAVRLRKLVLEKEGGIDVQAEGEFSYKGTFSLIAKTSLLPIQKIDLIQSRHPDLSGALVLNVRGKGAIKNPNLKLFVNVQNLEYRDAKMESGMIKGDWQEGIVTFEGTFPEKKFSLNGTLKTASPYPFSFQSHFDNMPIHSFLKKKLPSTPSAPGVEMPAASPVSLDPSEEFLPSQSSQGSQGTSPSVGLYVGGEISGKGDLKRLEQIDLTATLTLLSGSWGDYSLTNEGSILFHAEKGVFIIEKAVLRGPDTYLTLSGGVTPLKKWGLAVKGTADLNLLPVFVSKIRSGKGIAQFDLRITDRWEDPKIQGVFSLKEGLFYLKDVSQPVLISSLSLVFNRQFLILETLEGEMGWGRFAGSGKATLKGFDFPLFGFQLDIDNIPIALTPDLTAVVKGALLFTGDKEARSLDGTIHIREAIYKKRIDLRQTIMEWLDRRQEQVPIEIPFMGSTKLNIHLHGKENIVVNNNVANISLDVDLHLKGILDAPQVFGQINIPKGTFYFRANEFKVTSGVVQFVNAKSIEPSFDIKGKAKVRNYAVDIALTGMLSQFDLSLASLPPLPEVDIFSLLAVGKTTAEVVATGGETATLIVSDVVSSYFAEPVKQLTGADRILVGASGSKSSKNTLISLEKRILNDKLLIVYSTALDPSEEQRTQLYYELSKNVVLVSEQDEKGRIGGDIRFRFEFR